MLSAKISTEYSLDEFSFQKLEQSGHTLQASMASGLKRDSTVILRIDGEDLEEFINGPTFESEMASIFSQIDTTITLHDSILSALHKLGVEHGLPPPSDSWVMSNILEPALEDVDKGNESGEPISQEKFLNEFKRIAEKVREHLKEQPVIVAHTESLFDGASIKRLLSNKFELEKAINNALETLPRDNQGKISKDNLHMALTSLSSSNGLPPFGTFPEVDKVAANVLRAKANENGKAIKEEEFKKLLEEILGGIMGELECNPISVSSSSVAHDTIISAASST